MAKLFHTYPQVYIGCMCLPISAAAVGWGEFEALLLSFAPLFTQPTFGNVRPLAIGALLSPSRRTVTAALRISALEAKRTFTNYHRVLSRARWKPRKAATRPVPTKAHGPLASRTDRKLISLLLSTLLFGLQPGTKAKPPST
jgi:hypothetical protein